MSEQALSAQGTLMYHRRDGSGVFNLIGEMRDFNGPELMRNTIETTSHDDEDDAYVVGIRRKGEISGTIGWRGNVTSHQNLRDSWEEGDRDVFYIDFTDGARWVFSGFVTNLSPSMPVDDGFTMDFTIQATGVMLFVDPV